MARALGGQAGCVLAGDGDVVDRARPDDDDEAAVRAVEEGVPYSDDSGTARCGPGTTCAGFVQLSLRTPDRCRW